VARLHEHQGKALLVRFGFEVPRGGVARSPEQAAEMARGLDGSCVIKIQAWTTGRASIGGIAMADSPVQAAEHARRMLAMRVGQFPVTELLVEEKIAMVGEWFISLSIDDRERRPVLLVSQSGGSGIEQRAAEVHRILCDVRGGPDEEEVLRALRRGAGDEALAGRIATAARGVFNMAKAIDARSIEINPLGVMKDGRIVAVDCRVTVDDYAVYRRPELGIDIARELDHPPTALERVAYAVEQEDHRGTFYFAQLARAAPAGSHGLIGFHGAGGGGSMMSMDAVTNENFTIADFTDTSGNPSAAKVYRAARIILAQPGLAGYFGSGSGVASQEQIWSAYGLAKAFWEVELDIPAVIRLGGNSEDRAVEILESACKGLPAMVEGYRKTDSPAFIARRFAELVGEGKRAWRPRERRVPEFVGASTAVSFVIKSGRVWIDAARWGTVKAIVLANAYGLLRDADGVPALAVGAGEFASKDSELVACEVECRRAGADAVFVDLEIPGLDQAIAAAGGEC
jgi:succinyl-CoA synthetase beta subunit